MTIQSYRFERQDIPGAIEDPVVCVFRVQRLSSRAFKDSPPFGRRAVERRVEHYARRATMFHRPKDQRLREAFQANLTVFQRALAEWPSDSAASTNLKNSIT